jgi:hypothetical protein
VLASSPSVRRCSNGVTCCCVQVLACCVLSCGMLCVLSCGLSSFCSRPHVKTVFTWGLDLDDTRRPRRAWTVGGGMLVPLPCVAGRRRDACAASLRGRSEEGCLCRLRRRGRPVQIKHASTHAGVPVKALTETETLNPKIPCTHAGVPHGRESQGKPR